MTEASANRKYLPGREKQIKTRRVHTTPATVFKQATHEGSPFSAQSTAPNLRLRAKRCLAALTFIFLLFLGCGTPSAIFYGCRLTELDSIIGSGGRIRTEVVWTVGPGGCILIENSPRQ